MHFSFLINFVCDFHLKVYDEDNNTVFLVIIKQKLIETTWITTIILGAVAFSKWYRLWHSTKASKH